MVPAVRPTIDTILFDLDGTLTDSGAGIVRSVRYALEAVGMPATDDDDLLWCVGPPLRENIARLLPGAESTLVERAIDHYRERYDRTGYLENKVYDGIHDVLATLGREHRLILTTAKMLDVAETVLDAFELRRHFVGVYGSHRDGTFSDKRELLAHVIETHRLSSATTALVGDREHDMIAARYHRMTAIGAGYGYGSRAELINAGAHVICETPREIVSAIEALRTSHD
ncbi:MAG TPA: HAD hydrolase-like protein [Candidatus Binataceae bacterium]|nr:HAD hydrolase-like protein [Candidatus Binataceae bacterium]